MKLTFLGTGTSFGVPQIGCACEVCRSDDPRDKRTRVGAVIEESGARILIDAPPELRLQLIANRIADVDAVLFTHDHADHTHGIDDIRAISLRRGGALPMYGPAETLALLRDRFAYILQESRPIEIEFAADLPDVPTDWQFIKFRPSERFQGAVAVRRGSEPPLRFILRRDVPLETTGEPQVLASQKPIS